MKQTIGCVIRKVQASQKVPKENQMIKTTIKNNTTQNKTKEWQIFTASICNGTWVLLSAGHKIRDVHFSIGGGHRWSWCQPVWGETFILRREKCTVSHPLGLGPRTDLPVELLLLMTMANDPVL